MADSYALPPRLLALLDDMPLEELAFAAVPVKRRHDGWSQDRMLDKSLERSLVGEVVPIVRDGRVVGERHRYDNRLSFAVLNALDRRAEGRLGRADPAAVFRAALDALAQGGKADTH